jgi:hypothetical protein
MTAGRFRDLKKKWNYVDTDELAELKKGEGLLRGDNLPCESIWESLGARRGCCYRRQRLRRAQVERVAKKV